MTAAITVLPPAGCYTLTFRPTVEDGRWIVQALIPPGKVVETWEGMADEATAHYVTRILAQAAAKERLAT